MKNLVKCKVRGPRHGAYIVGIEDDYLTGILQTTREFYEIDLLLAIRALKLDGIFVDVGAHIGNHTTFFALECTPRSVISFEPAKRTYEALEATVKANKLSERVQLLRFGVHNRRTSCAMTSGGKNTGSARVTDGDGDIRLIRLDEVLFPRTRVDLIKMDVEGLERSAILSGLGVISRDLPYLSLEARKLSELLDLLEPLGYEVLGRYCATPTYLLGAR